MKLNLFKEDLWAVLILLVGSVFRVLWPYDMEWKYDQVWMYEAAVQFAYGVKTFDWVGMESSAGIPNPGLSVWLFIQIAKITSAPVGMVQAIQWINVICLWLFWVLFRFSHQTKKKDYLWKGILWMAIAPLPVVLSRIIWAQCLVLPFVLLMLWGYFRREEKFFSLLWGAAGILMGQVHMAGFFLFLSLSLVSFYFDWKESKPFRNWIYWGVGCELGFIPMVPWIKLFLFSSRKSTLSFGEHFNPKLFLHWFSTLWGVNLNYALGSDFQVFLSRPWRTYFIGFLVLALGIQGLVVLIRDLKQVLKNKTVKSMLESSELEQRLFLSFFWIYLFSFMVAGASTYVHYLILVFPVMYAWGAWRLSSYNPKFFWCVLAQQAILTCSLLVFFHQECRIDRYGNPYRCQEFPRGSPR